MNYGKRERRWLQSLVSKMLSMRLINLVYLHFVFFLLNQLSLQLLALIRQTHETLHFKDTQIAVQMIEFDSYSSLTKDTFSTA